MGSTMRGKTAEQVGSKALLCGYVCCYYCCLLSSHSGSNHLYRLGQINAAFVISGILVSKHLLHK